MPTVIDRIRDRGDFKQQLDFFEFGSGPAPAGWPGTAVTRRRDVEEMCVQVSVDLDEDQEPDLILRQITDVLASCVFSRTGTLAGRLSPAQGLRLTGANWGVWHFDVDRSRDWQKQLSHHLTRPSESQVGPELPRHALLAAELREITGLPAASLGAALGVTREQYQRWLAGSAISTIREGQLEYLATIAADVSRRLGGDQATVWWRTPTAEGLTPEALLKRRLVDRVHEMVTKLSDPRPIAGDTYVALLHQTSADIDDDPFENEDTPEAWSPYTKRGVQSE